jgi:DNA-binding winged helix-turn-helix (wHTH) protein
VRVRFAEYCLDTDARQLFEGARAIHLSRKAFEFLKVLVEERPRALSKEELLGRVWPEVFVSEASLARCVNEIRDAIGDHSRTEGFVQTVHGFGYRFASVGVADAKTEGPAGPICRLLGPNLEFHISNGTHIVGREPGVEIRLVSAKVSRHHARVVVNGVDVVIEDLNSKNGTFVRRQRITKATPLQRGDEVQIGPITLVLEVRDPSSDSDTEAWTRDSR